MKDITILENFINDDELEEARRAIDRSSWKHKSTSNATGVVFWYADMIQEKTLCKQLVTKIEKLSGKSKLSLTLTLIGRALAINCSPFLDVPL